MKRFVLAPKRHPTVLVPSCKEISIKSKVRMYSTSNASDYPRRGCPLFALCTLLSLLPRHPISSTRRSPTIHLSPLERPPDHRSFVPMQRTSPLVGTPWRLQWQSSPAVPTHQRAFTHRGSTEMETNNSFKAGPTQSPFSSVYSITTAVG